MFGVSAVAPLKFDILTASSSCVAPSESATVMPPASLSNDNNALEYI